MLKSILFLYLPLLFLMELACQNKATQRFSYKKDSLIYENDFENTLSDFIVETKLSKTAAVKIENGKLIIDVDCGASVWLNKKLSGNYVIEYSRKVIMENGKNDRLSDLNQFWMANDPKNHNLFTREGNFKEYDSLQLYYFGIGGNRNTTTRFRKYLGTGNRELIYDFNEDRFLLQPNNTYKIRTVVYNGTTQVFMDGKEYFSYQDRRPLKKGYFGFRTTESRQEIDDLKIYRLK